MAKGDPPEPHKSAEHEREVVDYTFRIKIDVSGPADVDTHVRKLVDDEFQRLYAAIQQKTKCRPGS